MRKGLVRAAIAGMVFAIWFRWLRFGRCHGLTTHLNPKILATSQKPIFLIQDPQL
jgi:hypothetical protein